jgi:hypothetical protein
LILFLGTNRSIVPPKDKAVKYTSPPWSVMADGYLVDVKPHLHDGGINMTFFVNNRLACNSDAVYGGDGGFAIDGQKYVGAYHIFATCANRIADGRP